VIDVLANDSDVDGEINAAMLSILEQPNHGTVSIVGGKVEYKANEAGLADRSKSVVVVAKIVLNQMHHRLRFLLTH